ncbi:cell wall-binding repeat-containing protein [Kineococcus terrestris]|uniref:cell wall-binding repeat-containing protein n=1 Tax=Kineococcus terrestris TaxID=2044856 RepID=UPI0034DB286A
MYLVTKDEVPAAVRERIIYARNIVVVGSESAIGADVWTWLRQNTRAGLYRVEGRDRFETSVALSRAFFPTPADGAAGPSRVVVATGYDFPDALTGSAAAAHASSPMLLVGRDEVPSVVADELRRLRPERITVVGGAGKVSDAVLRELQGLARNGADRVSGVDRYDTAVRVSHDFFDSARVVTLASGEGFADALAAGARAARADGPLLLSSKTCFTEGTNLEIERVQGRFGENGVANSFGGPGVLSETARKRTNCQPAGTAPKTYLDELVNGDGSARYVSDHAMIGGRFFPRSAAFDADPRNSDYKVWKLGDRYSRFTTVAGLDDANPTTFESTVEVFGDERLLTRQRVSRGAPTLIDVDVRGVNNLKLVTTSPGAAPRTEVLQRNNLVYFGDAAVS